MMTVLICYDVCMLFLLIIITLSYRNEHKTIYEKDVNISYNYL